MSEKAPKTGKIRIKVSSDIVGRLSFGVYKNFARAVRELVSNSYDADATEVSIGMHLDSQPPSVVVRDNGNGMDVNDIGDRLFFLASETPFTDKPDSFGRKRIGQFGIGFLSTFPYCDKIILTSKKKEQDSVAVVEIETKDFFQGSTFNITDKELEYKQYKSDIPEKMGETIIKLEGIKPHILAQLKKPKISKSSTYIDRFEGFDKFKWSIAQFAPLAYPNNMKELEEFFTYDGRKPLRLWLDTEELFRNVPEGAQIIEKGEKDFGQLHIKYVLMTPYRPIEPKEARGLQIRVCDSGIGLPTDFDVIRQKSKNLGKLNYFCGEIHITSGIIPIMIDRDSLSFTQEYDDMQHFFMDKLTYWNDKLEDAAKDQKEITNAMRSIAASNELLEQLQGTDILRFPKDRIRAFKKRSRAKHRDLSARSHMIAKALEKAGYEVRITDEKGTSSLPVKVNTEQKVVIIREDHPALKERLSVLGQDFTVEYQKWETTESLESAYKITGNTIIFNTGHPIFKINLDDNELKRILLGLELITSHRADRSQLMKELLDLLVEVF